MEQMISSIPGGRAKNTIAAALFMLVLLPSCSSSIRFYPATLLRDESLASRPSPARATTESRDALASQGYAAIGWIGTAGIVRTCAGAECKTFTCAPPEPVPDKLADEILAAAAKHGGELVDVRLASTATSTVPLGWSKCTQLGIAFRRRGGDPAVRDSGTWGWFAECVAWSRNTGRECASFSGGTVWRHDPELAQRLAENDRGLVERESERNRLIGEAVANREIYASLHGFYTTGKHRADETLLPFESWGRFGFRDKGGAAVIKPAFAAVLQGFSEGLAGAAVVVQGRQRWGFIDKTGAWVIHPRYDRVTDFSEGMAGAEEDGRAGYIDRNGTFIIKPLFDRVSPFRGSIAEVWINGKAGYYDRSVRKLFAAP